LGCRWAYIRAVKAPAPADYPVWPLWWAPIAFLHTRHAGGLLLAGLLGWSIWVAIR
jgi:1,4-dihydroxy-2-naphthoate octaprenyltransferase